MKIYRWLVGEDRDGKKKVCPAKKPEKEDNTQKVSRKMVADGQILMKLW